jgi:hypothetical protein
MSPVISLQEKKTKVDAEAPSKNLSVHENSHGSSRCGCTSGDCPGRCANCTCDSKKNR